MNEREIERALTRADTGRSINLDAARALDPQEAFEGILRLIERPCSSKGQGRRRNSFDFRCKVEVRGARRPLYSRVLTLEWETEIKR